MKYELLQGAEEDFRSILDYTAENWGAAQARHYARTLKEGFEKIASGAAKGKQHIQEWPELRMYLCGQHYICYTVESDHIAIAAVYHSKMDVLNRLKKRFEA